MQVSGIYSNSTRLVVIANSDASLFACGLFGHSCWVIIYNNYYKHRWPLYLNWCVSFLSRKLIIWVDELLGAFCLPRTPTLWVLCFFLLCCGAFQWTFPIPWAWTFSGLLSAPPAPNRSAYDLAFMRFGNSDNESLIQNFAIKAVSGNYIDCLECFSTKCSFHLNSSGGLLLIFKSNALKVLGVKNKQQKRQ